MYTFMPCTMETTAIRKVTPISTPRSEKKLLSFWVRIVVSAMPTASLSIMSGRCLPATGVTRDQAVPEDDHRLGMAGDVGVVGHHDDRLSEVLLRLPAR